ncbi:phosphoribosylamine--glycine ligase [Candidatus Gracilibacteria bacterium]|nr:phosphoribosylamine--glycine ligase [Candidatus Gracilibacteria bacterium]
MIKILLVGNGAREHCIAEALTKNGRAELIVYAKARNPGLMKLANVYELGGLSDAVKLKEIAQKYKPDFAVIGPDDPIADGMADALKEIGIPSVAPLKTLARLESSKSFTRDVVKKYNIPGNPQFRVFTSEEGMKAFIAELGGNYVVKADGLMGGKGVQVSGEHLATAEDGISFAQKCIEKFGRVVIEEKFVGQEFSLMSFVDGKTVVDMPAVQDHKRAYEGDTGPNTGGMGTYSCENHILPFLKPEDVAAAHDITVQVMHALTKETGEVYKGIMYGGFMAVKDGVRLIEYNARFGDPEVMNVLPILKNDFVEVCQAIIEGRLSELTLEFEKKATVCKYVVPEGYPENPKAGEKISIDMSQVGDGARMYYASVDEKEGEIYLSTSRGIAFVGIAETLEKAEQLAQKSCTAVKGPVFFRSDVGTHALVQKRIDMMNELRG